MTSWFAQRVWLGGSKLAKDVLIEEKNGHISRVTTDQTCPEHATQLAGIIVPGFVNAHSHAFHRTLRGKTHTSGGDFWTWRTRMYEVAARLTPANYEALAGEVFAEMLRAGITTVGEFHYVHHQPDGTPYPQSHAMANAVVNAARSAGIRLTLIDACYLASDITGSPVTGEQLRFSDRNVGAWADRVLSLHETLDSPSVKLGVAAHSVRAVGLGDLPTIVSTASHIDAPIHVHVSEQRSENAECLTEHGISPTGLLEQAGFLSENTTLIHATHVSSHDVGLLSASTVGVTFCPTTERELGDGIGPAHELREQGISLSLGTDSNAVIDMFEEMRGLEMNDRLRLERRGVHSPDELLASATVAGLGSLGWGEHEPFAIGSPADFIAISEDGPEFAGTSADDRLAAIPYLGERRSVTDVIVAGAHRVMDSNNVTNHSPSSLADTILALMP